MSAAFSPFSLSPFPFSAFVSVLVSGAGVSSSSSPSSSRFRTNLMVFGPTFLSRMDILLCQEFSVPNRHGAPCRSELVTHSTYLSHKMPPLISAMNLANPKQIFNSHFIILVDDLIQQASQCGWLDNHLVGFVGESLDRHWQRNTLFPLYHRLGVKFFAKSNNIYLILSQNWT